MTRIGNRLQSPLKVEEIAAVLGTGTGNMSVNCSTPNLNKWAKYKPYRSIQQNTLPDATRGDSPYNYGMSWPIFNSPTAANASGQKLYQPYDNDTASAQNAMNGWQYLKPRGRNSAGGDEWGRTKDFDGYDHDATQPLIIMAGSISASTALTTVATIGALRKEVFTAYEIDLATMPATKDWYYALVGYRLAGDIPANPDYFVVSNTAKISTGDFSGFNFPSSRLGSWAIYPCLCSVGGINFFQAAGQSLPSAQYIPLPCTKRWLASVASNQRTARLYGQKISSTSLKYRLVIDNDSSGAYTFNGVVVWLVHNSTVPPATLQYDERSIYIDNTGTQGQVSVAANSSYDTGWVTVTGLPSSLMADVTLYATCSAGFDRVGPIMPLYPN